MNPTPIPCPDCRTADHLVPAQRPRTDVDAISAAYTGWLGVAATEADLKAWARCRRCGALIRQRRAPLPDFFARLFFGAKARPGAVIRPRPSPSNSRTPSPDP